jgi:hypothetical protein
MVQSQSRTVSSIANAKSYVNILNLYIWPLCVSSHGTVKDFSFSLGLNLFRSSNYSPSNKMTFRKVLSSPFVTPPLHQSFAAIPANNKKFSNPQTRPITLSPTTTRTSTSSMATEHNSIPPAASNKSQQGPRVAMVGRESHLSRSQTLISTKVTCFHNETAFEKCQELVDIVSASACSIRYIDLHQILLEGDVDALWLVTRFRLVLQIRWMGRRIPRHIWMFSHSMRM